MTDFKYYDAPTDWTVCLRTDCPRGSECLRRKMVEEMTERVVCQSCIMPTAYTDEGCAQFAEAQPVRVAWGMKRLLSRVRPWHFGPMKQELEDYFGSHSTYYRYRNGLYPISPKRQAWIADLLRRYGYDDAPVFDHCETTCFFPGIILKEKKDYGLERYRKEHECH